MMNSSQCSWHSKQRFWFAYCQHEQQHKKPEYVKGAISKGKAYLLGDKKQWTQERTDKASGETINKTFIQYKERELSEKS